MGEGVSRTCQQTSRMELFVHIVNDCKPLTSFTKISILDGWQGSEYVSCVVVEHPRIAWSFGEITFSQKKLPHKYTLLNDEKLSSNNR